MGLTLRVFLTDPGYPRSRSPVTQRAYEERLGQWGRFLLTRGRETFEEATVEDYHAFVTWQAQRDLSPRTVSCSYRHLRAFYNWLQKQGYVTVSPLADIRVQEPLGEPKALEDDDLARLIRAYDARTDFVGRRNQAIVRFLLDTGVRVGEAASILMRDVHLDADPPHLVVVATDPGEMPRSVGWGRQTDHFLRRYLLERERLGIESDHLFSNVYGQPLTPGRISHIFSQAGRLVGMDVGPGAHRARHSLGRAAALQGKSERAIAEILGHRTGAMARLYSRLWNRDRLQLHREISPVDRARPAQAGPEGRLLRTACTPALGARGRRPPKPGDRRAQPGPGSPKRRPS